MPYGHTPIIPSHKQQKQDYINDLRSDAEQAEHQAIHGPFYPEKDITPETLRAYAAECRAKIPNAGNELAKIRLSTFPMNFLAAFVEAH